MKNEAIKSFIKRVAFPLLLLKNHGQRVSIDAESARKYLEDFSPKPIGTVYADNQTNIKYDLMIIVAAYNAEKYLEQCLDSVLNQDTQYTYELVIVDDGSADRTGEIADRYSEKNTCVRVIHQENKGLSGARNSALKTITGRYITFLDADDYLPQGAVQAWMELSSASTDIVEGAAIRFEDDMSEDAPIVHPAEGIVNPTKYLLGFPWGKIYSARLFEHFKFPEGYLYEDTVLSMILYWKVHGAVVTNQYVYAYRQNNNGITRSSVGKPKSLDTYWITEYCLEEISKSKPITESMRSQILQQIFMNHSRTRKLPEIVRQSIFVLTATLYKKHFAKKANLSLFREKVLDKALREKKYGLYDAVMRCWSGL